MRASAAWFVGIVWAALTVSDLWYVVRFGPTMPYWDDWELVPAVSGEKPLTAAWLWSPHNEHRLFIPRLLLFWLYRLSGYDFRAGMYFNTLALSGLALAMVLAARAVRGRCTWADAVFPLALLSWAHFENLLWSWQVGFVLSAVPIGVVLLVIVRCGDRPGGGAIALMGACLLMLPLCGASGLLLALPPAVWLGACGVADLVSPGGTRRRQGWWMLLFAAAFTALAAAYLRGPEDLPRSDYESAARHLLKDARNFIGFTFGMGIAGVWRRRSETVALLLALTVVQLLIVMRRGGPERRRAAGLLAVLAGVGAIGAAVFWGRPGAAGAPRYITLIVPALLVMIWTQILYGRVVADRRTALGVLGVITGLAAPDLVAAVCLAYIALLLARLVRPVNWGQRLLCLLTAVSLLGNTLVGFDGGWFHRWVSDHFEHDLRSGMTAEELAQKYTHGPHRIYPNKRTLAHYIKLLARAGIGPFPHVPLPPPPSCRTRSTAGPK